jgi:hypothetical protein
MPKRRQKFGRIFSQLAQPKAIKKFAEFSAKYAQFILRQGRYCKISSF